MNYFELFEIPVSFELDTVVLKRKYYVLSKTFHPDRFTLKSETEQLLALNQSTEINKAYRTLKERQSRIRYILELKGVIFVEGQEKVPQDFLMEMMEINESLMELKLDPEPSSIRRIEKQIEEIETSLGKEISAVMELIDLDNPDESKLELVKIYYLKTKYLQRLRENLFN
ncbi:MAG: Fe-S protein assembly co-chaperone HscB [Bacteroidia bacterium]|nr:Fe-S protein assembly co-chaperone HscB [Bacteroidia bacterium]